MQIGLLVWIIGFAFALLIALPATIAADKIFRQLRMHFEDEQNFVTREYKERLWWSTFIYFCAIFYLIEWYFYSKLMYGENNLLFTLVLFLVASFLISLRVLMVVNEEKRFPKVINAIGRGVLYIWIATIIATMILGFGVLLFGSE